MLPTIIRGRCQGQLQLLQGAGCGGPGWSQGLDGPREQREAGSCPSHRGSEWLELLLCVLVQDTADW